MATDSVSRRVLPLSVSNWSHSCAQTIMPCIHTRLLFRLLLSVVGALFWWRIPDNQSWENRVCSVGGLAWNPDLESPPPHPHTHCLFFFLSRWLCQTRAKYCLMSPESMFNIPKAARVSRLEQPLCSLSIAFLAEYCLHDSEMLCLLNGSV